MTLVRPAPSGARFSGLSAALAAAVGLSGCAPHSPADDPRTQAQLVEVVEVQPAAPGANGFTGVIAARVQSNLGFRVSGKVVERLVDAGQAVRRGQPLMRLDATDFENAAAAQAASVAVAKARLVQAAADEERYRDLVSPGAVSRSAYDQAKQAADSARALLSAAEAQLRVARDQQAYSTLLADADGVVMETTAEPGQYVGAGQSVLRLAHAGPREAVVSLPETLRPAIGSSSTASVYGSQTRAAARLRQLSQSADPLTRTYEARYVLDGPNAQAPLGATATIYLSSPGSQQELAVPLGAITDNGRGPGVWVLIANAASVSFRPARIARLEAERAIISGGLSAGERIVALGAHELHEGERVRTAQPGARP